MNQSNSSPAVIDTQIPNDIDFGRSFVHCTSEPENHTPRLGLAACCTLSSPGQKNRSYFLSVACIAENMYRGKDLIHDPAAEFTLIVSPAAEFLMIKRHASAEHDVRSAHRVGEVMPSRDGRGSKLVEVNVSVARYGQVHSIKDYVDFRQGLLENYPINGRTTYIDGDQTSRVTLDYPVTTCNVRHDPPGWQVDAGPLLIPDRSLSGSDELEINRLELAYMVYNRFDYAEAIVRRSTAVSADQPTILTNHYSHMRTLQCSTELFWAE